MAVLPKATIDFETRSACNLKTHGTWAYSVHPSTEILCLIYRLPHWPKGVTGLWHPAISMQSEHIEGSLEELLEWVVGGGLVEAHNVFFEYCIWNNLLSPSTGWPTIPIAHWRCSAAKAAAHALPRSLEGSSVALRIPQRKDVEGHKLMLKMSKPRKSWKKERELWAKTGQTPPKRLWHESAEMLDRLIAYCRQDVLTEEAVSHALPDLNEQEQSIFEMDLRINVRGFQLDKKAVTIALRLIYRESVLLNQELTLLTERKVKRATQRTKMIEWFQSQGLEIYDTQKATLDALVINGRSDDGNLQAPDTAPLSSLSSVVYRCVEIVRSLGRSSTAKYQSMRAWAARDGRVRGGLLYHGASTGRWSGKGVQPHNFPKGSQKVDQDTLWALLKEGQRDQIAAEYRSVMEALSSGLRGAITAKKGHTLYVADYASIEARVLLWLADDQAALDTFREGRDIYCEMAESVYHRPITKADGTERSMGKIAVLGLGYQMGASKFLATCGQFGIVIEEDFAKTVVDAYRQKFWKVKALWEDQEAAAMQAVETRRSVQAGQVRWFLSGKFLYCELPSGRRLAYPFPEIQSQMMPWGAQRDVLTFMAVDGYSHKWKRVKTYGGSIVENIVQAIARDIMAEAMLRLEDTADYSVVLSVHDEIVAEAALGTGSVEQFTQLMEWLPDWASGCPIAAESWNGTRYHK